VYHTLVARVESLTPQSSREWGFFGRMSGAEWGVTQYKHLDHHLRQFGA
jgi:hypothetical protein